MPRAFITGITGQDGQHLAEFLHGKGYEVFGMVKGQNNPRMTQMRDEFPYVEPVPGDLADLPSLVKALELAQPDEVYNLGAISFVAMSFNQAELTANITGTRRAAHARRDPHRRRQRRTTRSASTRPVVVGDVRQGARDAADRDDAVPPALAVRLRQGVRPRHHGQLPRELRPVRLQRASCSTTRARAAASSSSPARSPTPPPASSSACSTRSCMGNLDSKRDWGYAGDYVKAMWMMLQQDEPDDYVIATGKTHSIEELVERAFAEVGIEDWRALRPPGPEVLPAGRGRPADRRLDQGPRPSSAGSPRSTSPSCQDDGRQRPRDRVRRRPGSRRRLDVSGSGRIALRSRAACR